MKAILLIAAMVVGNLASARVCADYWGNPARLSLSSSAASLTSARESSGILHANGESSTSYYFRDGGGTTLIVNKSVFAGGAGRVVLITMVEGGHGTHENRTNFYCR